MSSATQASHSLSPAEVINVESLLAPIAGENASGQNLHHTAVYSRIRVARKADDKLNKGDWKGEEKTSDWRQVAEIATDALARETKDIQITAWLAEALLNLHGFVGLRDGFKLMRGIIGSYWENLYPEIDEEGLEGRLNVFDWMNDTFPLTIKQLLITNASGKNYSYLDWEEILQNNSQEGIDEINKAKNASARDFYENSYVAINECYEEFQSLILAGNEKFGNEAPRLAVIHQTLDSVRDYIEKIVKEKRALDPSYQTADEGEAGADGGSVADGPVAVAVTGPVKSRREALKRLAEVADYFRSTEPHSPISYLVQRAINWGEMPLELWLEDVINDSSVLDRLRDTLGIKDKESK